MQATEHLGTLMDYRLTKLAKGVKSDCLRTTPINCRWSVEKELLWLVLTYM